MYLLKFRWKASAIAYNGKFMNESKTELVKKVSQTSNCCFMAVSMPKRSLWKDSILGMEIKTECLVKVGSFRIENRFCIINALYIVEFLNKSYATVSQPQFVNSLTKIIA